MNAPWQTDPPDTTGRWEMRCDETYHRPKDVAVVNGPHGHLWVEDPDIGNYPLTAYHDGHCSLQWRKCESGSDNPWQRKAEIYEHALRLIANDKTNPEGWATDKQIADHYLQKGSMPVQQQTNKPETQNP